MIEKICLKKTENTLDDISYLQPCSICACFFTTNKNEDICSYCLKNQKLYIGYNFFLFSIKDVFLNYAEFSENKISKYEFINLEEKLIDISLENILFDYNIKNMYWYVKIPKENCDALIVYAITKTIVALVAFVLNFFDLQNKVQFKNLEDQVKQEIINISINDIKKNRILNLRLCDGGFDLNHLQISMNRNYFLKKLNDNFDFFLND